MSIKAKRKRLKPIKHIYDETYRTNIWYFKGWTREEYTKYIARKYGSKYLRTDDSEVRASVLPLAIQYKKKDMKEFEDTTVLCLWLGPTTDLEIMVHECFHITSHTLRTSGIVLGDDSEEAFAYHLAWIVSKINEIGYP